MYRAQFWNATSTVARTINWAPGKSSRAGSSARTVAVAWVGFDRPRPLGAGETGGRAALPIWLHAMQAAESGKPPLSFDPPASVLVRMIDPGTGLLAPEPLMGVDGVVLEGDPGEFEEEYFVAGTEPVEHAEPAAIPAGDAVLDLYGDGGFEDALSGDSAGVAPAGSAVDDGDDGRVGLPSVTDDP